MALRPSTLEEIKKASEAVIELPPFAQGTRFCVRVRRPSLLVLVKSGKIPNQLLATANELFMGTSHSTKEEDMATQLENLSEVVDIMCESMLLEPTWDELKEAKIELTDEQKTTLFNYSQHGVAALKKFRQQSESVTDTQDGETV